MFSPAFLSGQTTCTVCPTACIACSKTKISYSSLNSPVSIRIFLPGIGLLPALSSFSRRRRRCRDGWSGTSRPIRTVVEVVGTVDRQRLRDVALAVGGEPVGRLGARSAHRAAAARPRPRAAWRPSACPRISARASRIGIAPAPRGSRARECSSFSRCSMIRRSWLRTASRRSLPTSSISSARCSRSSGPFQRSRDRRRSAAA